MKIKNSIKLLTITMICSGLLAACNQTGSGANSSNNSTVSKTVVQNAVPDTQKILRISNKTGSVINSVSIVSKDGQMIHQSSSGLDCADQEICILDIGGIVIDKTMLAKFYNNKNQLVSLAALKDNSAKLTYMTVYTDSTIFGANLFKQLVAFENSTPAKVLAQLTAYFKPAKNAKNVDVFEDLGNYYTQQLKSGHITTEEHFFQSLKTGFANHQTVAPPAQPPLMMAGLGCDPGIGDTVFKFISPFKALPEVGAVITGIADMSQAIFDTVCTSDSFDFQGAFDQLNEKLDKIQSSLDALGVDVAALRSLVIDLDVDHTNIKLSQVYEMLDQYQNEYNNFLGEDTSSIYDFVKLKGGIDKALPKADALKEIITTIPTQQLNITDLTGTAQLKQISDQLQAKCGNYYNGIKDSSGQSQDIFKATDMCTTQAILTATEMTVYAQLYKLRMIDLANAIATSANPSKQFKNPFPLAKGQGWADVPAYINQDTSARINRTFAFMKDNVFNGPRNDLADMKIQLTMPENGCSTTAFNKTKVFPYYMNWNNTNYDSITVVVACNGKAPATRALLPGGVYGIDTSNNGNSQTWIGMDNAADWEISSTVNPFISPNSGFLETGNKTNIFGTALDGKGGTYDVDVVPALLQKAKDLLTKQGRGELASGLDIYRNRTSYGGDHHPSQGLITISQSIPTRLFIPVVMYFEGEKTTSIWASSDGRLYMAKYGDKNDIRVRHYNSGEGTSAFNYGDPFNVDGYRSVDYNWEYNPHGQFVNIGRCKHGPYWKGGACY